MARYWRKRYYRYRRRAKRYRRRYRKYKSLINGSSKSTVRVKIPTEQVQTVQVAQAGTVGTFMVVPWKGYDGAPAYMSQSVCDATSFDLYRIYASLYQEVKCLGCKVRITIGTPIGTATLPDLTVVTAWNRRTSPTDTRNIPNFTTLGTYSTAAKAIAVNNSIGKLSRSCYASDLIERAQWHDCTIRHDTNYNYYFDEAYTAANMNVNFFSPGMYFALQTSAANTPTVRIMFQTTWYFSFRNPRYGGSSSSRDFPAGEVDVMGDDQDGAPPSAARAIVRPRDLDDEGDAMNREDAAAAAAAPAAERPRSTSRGGRGGGRNRGRVREFVDAAAEAAGEAVFDYAKQRAAEAAAGLAGRGAAAVIDGILEHFN